MIRFSDILDIAFIALLVYLLLLWLRQRTSRSPALVLTIVVVLYGLARMLNMYMTSLVFQTGLTALLVALVLIFQTDLRRGFDRLFTFKRGRGKHGTVMGSQTVDVLVESVSRLAHDRIGALIVLKGTEPIERHIRGGFSLNGRLSLPILYSIFRPPSPSHDGAVIVEGELIDRYGVYLPLSQNLPEGKEAGTRHAAGLGMSECSDALVIIVSEERGVISIASRGELTELDSATELKARLEQFYGAVHPSGTRGVIGRLVGQNVIIKLVSVCAAFGCWYFFAYHGGTLHRSFLVPIEYRKIPPQFVIDDPGITAARVSLSGPQQSFLGDYGNMILAVDLGAVHEGAQDIYFSEQTLLNRPANAAVTQIEPRMVHIKAYALVSAMLPVKLTLEGGPVVRLARVSVEPESVRVLLPRVKRSEISAISTEPVKVSALQQSATLRVPLLLPDHVQMAGGGEASVKVKIEGVDKKK
ncbi:MAG: diadenylate cyclase [Chitinivibrionales bacterium]|nr:diadenylate cyclase [Chitinivibrionales bacterium]